MVPRRRKPPSRYRRTPTYRHVATSHARVGSLRSITTSAGGLWQQRSAVVSPRSQPGPFSVSGNVGRFRLCRYPLPPCPSCASTTSRLSRYPLPLCRSRPSTIYVSVLFHHPHTRVSSSVGRQLPAATSPPPQTNTPFVASPLSQTNAFVVSPLPQVNVFFAVLPPFQMNAFFAVSPPSLNIFAKSPSSWTKVVFTPHKHLSQLHPPPPCQTHSSTMRSNNSPLCNYIHLCTSLSVEWQHPAAVSLCASTCVSCFLQYQFSIFMDKVSSIAVLAV